MCLLTDVLSKFEVFQNEISWKRDFFDLYCRFWVEKEFLKGR